MKKTCFKCKEEKSILEFYKHSGMLDGYLNKCKSCTCKDVREHRRNNESVRQYDRERYYNNPARREAIEITVAFWINNNPEAKAAHTKLNNAVRDGKIKKEPCSVCGSTYRIHGHHDDYSKPLDVKWFCAKHHQRLHNPFLMENEKWN